MLISYLWRENTYWIIELKEFLLEWNLTMDGISKDNLDTRMLHKILQYAEFLGEMSYSMKNINVRNRKLEMCLTWSERYSMELVDWMSSFSFTYPDMNDLVYIWQSCEI